MKIVAENEQEQYFLKMLLQGISYAWDSCGKDSDVFYKAFEYINDRPECWKDGELIKDYEPEFAAFIKGIQKQKVIVE